MKYIDPEMEIMKLDLLDVITTSSEGLGTDTDIPEDPKDLPTIPGGEF